MKAAHKKQQQKIRGPRANRDLRHVIVTESEHSDDDLDEPDYIDDDDRKK
jgi:hypothetical protein